MTKHILHAIKKFLRIGVVVVTVTSGSINASAEVSSSEMCETLCNKQLNLSLDGSGYGLVSYSMIVQGEWDKSCFSLLDQVTVEIEGSSSVYLDVTQNGNTVATTSALLDYSFVGQNVKYKLIKHYSNGNINTCWGNVLIEDKMKPSIVCSDLTINCTENIDPFQLARNYRKSFPTISDNCGTPTLVYQDSEENYSCLNPDFLKKITRVWIATDGSGNQQTHTQNIFIERVDGSNIQFPSHVTHNNISTSNFQNKVLEPTITGHPTLHGINISDIESLNFSNNYQEQTINTYKGNFKILRNWTVVDWCTNEIFTHQQIIKVLEEVSPTTTCE